MRSIIKCLVPLAVIFLFAFLSSSLTACSSIGNQNTEMPNIIVIMTDDQPQHTLPYMPVIQKELVAKGITFSNAFATTPLCCPSRASILTGLYAHNHGVKTNRAPEGGAVAFHDQSTISVWLQDAGYRTGFFGKYLNGYNDLPEGYVPPGWDDWQAFVRRDPNLDFYLNYSLNENGKVIQYGKEPQDYSTDLLAERAVKFIRESRQQPFFLFFSAFAPHQTYQAAERHKDLFKSLDEFERYRPPSFFEADLTDKPLWANDIERPSVDYVDKVHERMLRSLMAVDDAAGSLISALERGNIRDNTIIIFMSDNGMSMGDNGVFGKNCPYDGCLRIPLVVSYPHLTSASRVDESLILNIDIAPTLIDFAGITSPTPIDGESFLPVLSSTSQGWRDGFLIEHFKDFADIEESGLAFLIPGYVGYRTDEWKYIEYETGEIELYNLYADPFELENLAYQDGYESIMIDLSEKIQAILP